MSTYTININCHPSYPTYPGYAYPAYPIYPSYAYPPYYYPYSPVYYSGYAPFPYSNPYPPMLGNHGPMIAPSQPPAPITGRVEESSPTASPTSSTVTHHRESTTRRDSEDKDKHELDPTLRRLAARATSDPHLKTLMKSVARGKASPTELEEFETELDVSTVPDFPGSNTTHKRSHSAIGYPSDFDDNGYESDGPITETCDAIRRQINKLINNGEMKVTEFQRACGINSNSYGRFMKLKGPFAGQGNQTYEAAFRFFTKRKAAGIKEPTKKKVKKSEESKKMDVSSTILEGEDDESVEVYDTCDDVRRKIAAYLREPNVTQAAFLRSLAQMLPDPTIKLQSKQLKDFQNKKGPLAGNTSRIYYTAYVFFEKQRIQQGKPKSKKRLENEDVWVAEGGIRRDRQMDHFYTGPGMNAYMDSHGRVRVA